MGWLSSTFRKWSTHPAKRMSEKRATFSDDCVESSGGKGNTQTTSDGFAQSKLSKSMSQATCDAASSRSARHLTRSPLKDGPGRNSCFGAGRSSRIGSIDSTGGLTPGVATSAAVGATVAGPAAPVGAAIGAAVSTLLRQAAGGTIGMRLARTAAAPAGLLKEAWRSVINSPEVLESLPNIGVLRTERTAYPPALHELTETNSYLYGSLPIVVSGLTYEHALEGGALSETLLETLQGSVASLEAKGVVAISGDSGALIHYQQEVTRMTRLPVALSSLLQAPLIAAVYPPEQKLLVITADAVAFSEARLCAVLLQLGVSEADAARFLLMGCEAIEGFRPGEEGAPIKMSDTAQQLVELVRGAQAAEEGIRGVLIESTMLPAFSDEIRKAATPQLTPPCLTPPCLTPPCLTPPQLDQNSTPIPRVRTPPYPRPPHPCSPPPLLLAPLALPARPAALPFSTRSLSSISYTKAEPTTRGHALWLARIGSTPAARHI